MAQQRKNSKSQHSPRKNKPNNTNGTYMYSSNNVNHPHHNLPPPPPNNHPHHQHNYYHAIKHVEYGSMVKSEDIIPPASPPPEVLMSSPSPSSTRETWGGGTVGREGTDVTVRMAHTVFPPLLNGTDEEGGDLFGGRGWGGGGCGVGGIGYGVVSSPELIGVFAAHSMEDMLHPAHKLGDIGKSRARVTKPASRLDKLPPLERSSSDSPTRFRRSHRYKTSLAKALNRTGDKATEASSSSSVSPTHSHDHPHNFSTSFGSPSLPDLTAHLARENKHPPPRRFDKLSYTKQIHHDLAPAPSGDPTPSPWCPVRQRTFQAKKRRRQRLEPLGIVNTLARCVEYVEHHGRVMVNAGGAAEGQWRERQWSTDCLCVECRDRRDEWVDETLRSEKHAKWRGPYAHARQHHRHSATVAEVDESEEGLLVEGADKGGERRVEEPEGRGHGKG